MSDIIEKRVTLTKYERADKKEYTKLASGFVCQSTMDRNIDINLKREVYQEMCWSVVSQFIDWCYTKVHIPPNYFDIELNISENPQQKDLYKNLAVVILAPKLKGKEQITTISWSDAEAVDLDVI